MDKKVVCAITIGDIETKKCNTYWLTTDEYQIYTEMLYEFIKRKEEPM